MIRTLLKDERGQLEALLLLLLLLVLAGAALLGGAIAAIIFLTPVALFIFIWDRVFPFARSIAEWTTNRVNFIPFVLFMLILINAIILLIALWFVLYAQTESSAFLILGLLLIPILLQALTIFLVPLGLAIVLWLIRLNHHLFDRFRTRFLTLAFRLVMRRAIRKQERAEPPQKTAKRRRWRAKRPQNKAGNPQNRAENPQKKAENPQNRAENPQKKAENPQKKLENPQSRPKKRRWRAKKRQ